MKSRVSKVSGLTPTPTPTHQHLFSDRTALLDFRQKQYLTVKQFSYYTFFNSTIYSKKKQLAVPE